MKELLSNRKQRVIINDAELDRGKITCRVQQGLVLGAALLFIYINDLDHAIETEFEMFTDDTGSDARVETGTGIVTAQLRQRLTTIFNLNKRKVL